MKTTIQGHESFSENHIILRYPVAEVVYKSSRAEFNQRWYDNKIYASSMINIFRYFPHDLKLKFGLDLLKLSSEASKMAYKADANGPISQDNLNLVFKTNYNKRWNDRIPILNVAFQHIENLPQDHLKWVCEGFYNTMENYSLHNKNLSLTDFFEMVKVAQVTSQLPQEDDHNLFVDVDFTSGKKHKK